MKGPQRPHDERGICCGPFIPDIRPNNDCQHPNAHYYGDTNPPTYKCPDCGLMFIPEDQIKAAVARVILKPSDPLDPDGVFNE